jgi:hypothetical protein
MASKAPLESTIQTSIVNVLTMYGYTVIEIGRTRRMVKCRLCGASTPAVGWQGNTPGAPDLMVTCDRWRGDWVGIEVKRPGGAIRPEQRALAEAGATSIVRSVRDALAVIVDAEARHGHQADRLEQVREQL